MAVGDIIYSLITLILMILIISSPLIKKIMKSAGKQVKGRSPSEDSEYDRVDSQKTVHRILSDSEGPLHIEFTEALPLKSVPIKDNEKIINVAEKLDRLTPLKRAVIWKEILDKPLGLR